MKNCNECHSINNSNAKYCRHCGAIFITTAKHIGTISQDETCSNKFLRLEET